MGSTMVTETTKRRKAPPAIGPEPAAHSLLLPRAPTGAFAQLPVLDLQTPEFRTDSPRVLKELATRTPICWVSPLDFVGLTRFADVDAILRDYRTFSSYGRQRDRVPGAEAEATISALITDDPPTHLRLRSLMSPVFSPKSVAAMEHRIYTVTRELLDDVLARGREFDFVRDFATPLPTTIIAHLLGVGESAMASFKRWSDDLISVLDIFSMPDSVQRQQRLAEIARSAHELTDYLNSVLAERRKAPAEDLISMMIRSSDHDERLTGDEITSLTKLLLIAGNETTTRLLGLSMNLLLNNPEQLRLVAGHRGLIPGALEETLRYEGPVTMISRRVTKACTLAELEVPPGMLVAAIVGAANHEESIFPQSLSFDIRRKLERHFAFGSGIHQCLGAPLARLEGSVALQELFSQLQDLEFAAPPERSPGLNLRGFSSMKLRYRPKQSGVHLPVDTTAFQDLATADKIAGLSDAQLGLNKRAYELVRVAMIRELSPTIKLLVLVHPNGGLLTRFTAGSHIVLHLNDGGKQYRNAYSLLNSAYGEGLQYFIAVQRERNSHGGSQYIHEKLRPGMELKISVPANNFPLAKDASKHLLIAGGIGITPLLSHRSILRTRQAPYELHYAYRDGSSAAFVEMLQMSSDPFVHFYDDSLGQRLEVAAVLHRQPDDTHVYVCGPESLMNAVITEATQFGWTRERIHYERFGAPLAAADPPFHVTCRISGKSFTVPANKTLLECIEEADIQIAFGCRAGSCGYCAVPVVSGAIDHRDSELSDAERAAGETMLPCVSRGSSELVLDI